MAVAGDHKNAVDWLFRNRQTGWITVGQMPNVSGQGFFKRRAI